jgi:Leucine-rich repeat (LRR) protein
MPAKDDPARSTEEGEENDLIARVEEGAGIPAPANLTGEKKMEKDKRKDDDEGAKTSSLDVTGGAGAAIPLPSKDDDLKSKRLLGELERGGVQADMMQHNGGLGDDDGDHVVVVEATRLVSQPNYILPGAVRVSSTGGLEVLSSSSTTFRATSSTFTPSSAGDGATTDPTAALQTDSEINLDDYSSTGAVPPPLPPPAAAVSSTTIATTDYLVEANLVTDRDDFNHPPMVLVEAHPVKHMEDEPKNGSKKWCGLALAFAIVAIVGVVVGVTLGTRSASRGGDGLNSAQTQPTGSPTASPSAAPTYDFAMEFRAQLPDSTVERIEADSKSPQARAYRWVITSMTDDAMGYLGLTSITEDVELKVLRRCSQRMALATLFFATNNTPDELPVITGWTNQSGWLNKTLSECKWFGCSCRDDDEHELLAINVASNGLVGSIPPEVGLMLTSLEAVNFSDNVELRGTVPTEIGLLTSLSELSFFFGHLNGTIPTELGMIAGLGSLDLSSNLLSGPIPSELGRLNNLSTLMLYGNLLNGPVPTSLDALSSTLSVLDLSRNALTGTVPTMLARLTQLKELYIGANALSGSIPAQLSELTGLKNLDLSKNRLTGTIPAELGNLTRLTYLFLEENNLNSTIPDAIGRLTKVQFLRLYQNLLSGPIPTTFGRLTDANEIFLDSNRLTGTLPTDLGVLSSLIELVVFENQLEGSVPLELCALISTGLTLDLDCNEIQCTCGCKCER